MGSKHASTMLCRLNLFIENLHSEIQNLHLLTCGIFIESKLDKTFREMKQSIFHYNKNSVLSVYANIL